MHGRKGGNRERQKSSSSSSSSVTASPVSGASLASASSPSSSSSKSRSSKLTEQNLQTQQQEQNGFDNSGDENDDYYEEGSGSEAGSAVSLEEATMEKMEHQIKDAMENLTEKRASTRESALSSLSTVLSQQYCAEVLDGVKVTLLDSLIKSAMRGETSERIGAFKVIRLMFVQLGMGLEDSVSELFETTKSTYEDHTINSVVRAASLDMLCTLAFFGTDNPEYAIKLAKSTYELILHAAKQISLVNDNSSQNASSGTHMLLVSAMATWCLLVPILPSHSQEFADVISAVPALSGLLSSPTLEVRIAAGEALAFAFERGRAIYGSDDQDTYSEKAASVADDSEVVESKSRRVHSKFDECVDLDDLCDRIKSLSTESSKYRAKRDKVKQRSVFRDVLSCIEDNEPPEDSVKLKYETVMFDSWEISIRANFMRKLLTHGFKVQLEKNPVLRDVFDLGATLSDKDKRKGDEKKYYPLNSQASKLRTQIMNKNRDKRSDF